MTKAQEYLVQVKNRLSINFADADEDLLLLINEAISRITAWTGKKEFNADALTVEDSIANSLIREYVRYARSGASDMFRKNHIDIILNLQLEVVRNANPTI